VDHVEPCLGGYFDGDRLDTLDDPRDADRTTYRIRHMIWIGLLMFLTGMRSRNQLRHEGNSVGFHANLLELAGTDDEAAAHPDTLDYLLQRLEPDELLDLLTGLVGCLLRMRCLEAFRLDREWVMAVDATELYSYPKRHCEHCLTRRLSNGDIQYFHAVLEGRLVFANGMTLCLGSVPIENPPGNWGSFWRKTA